jgi:hypothetical protein
MLVLVIDKNVSEALMFRGVNEKLERAGYFLDNIKGLAKEANDIAHIKREKQQHLRANIDAFFFEIISAKDFFLQGLNDKYANLPKDEGTQLNKLKRCCLEHSRALEVLKSIEKELSNSSSWLWKLNNYRNSATHRELLHIWNSVNTEAVVDKELFEKMKQAEAEGRLRIVPIFKGEEIPTEVPRFEISSEKWTIYFFKDPEDPEKGNADIEIIPYLEDSLKQMKYFLDSLYSELGIA